MILVSHQHPDGYWDQDWPDKKAADGESTSKIPDRILATGHALEWWALAPEHLHPPRHVLASAGQWLVREIDGLSEEETRQFYTFLTHAGRALTLWRGKSPADVVRFDLSTDSSASADNSDVTQSSNLSVVDESPQRMLPPLESVGARP